MISLKEMLIDWSEQVIASDEGHCIKEKQACMRFLRDIERENTDEFPYVFDNDAAMRFLEWMTQFKHSKGVLRGQPIDPAPIQIFNFGNVYGWKHRDTGFRRFNKMYWQVGRKNAKTQSLACVASYEASVLDESYSEVYIGATQTDQAKILWNETWIQLKDSEYASSYEKKYGRIDHAKSGGFIKALSKEAGKTGDGFNPQCGILDEYHAHTTNEIYAVLETGMMARTQPLLVIITTAGYELNNPCYAVEYQYVSKILDPESAVENDAYFCMVNELDKGDDVKDERNWVKANPIVASYETGMNNLRKSAREAVDVPEKMRDFLTKNMNIWVDIPDGGYMDMSKWDSNAVSEEEFDKFCDGAKFFIGFDLSATTDLTAISLVAVKNGQYMVKQWSYMPREKYAERMAKDKVRFDIYLDRGELILCDGATIDYHEVRYKILEIARMYKIEEICYDPYQASLLAHELENDEFVLVTIPQTIPILSEPTKEFRKAVYEGRVKHVGDKLLKWSMGNARQITDTNANIKISKKHSKDRIDPVDAIINAFVRAQASQMEVSIEDHIMSDEFSF